MPPTLVTQHSLCLKESINTNTNGAIRLHLHEQHNKGAKNLTILKCSTTNEVSHFRQLEKSYKKLSSINYVSEIISLPLIQNDDNLFF